MTKQIERYTYLDEHFFEFWLRVVPGGDRVAEEHKIVHYARRIDANEVANASEGRVLLVIVPNRS